ncbi:hypothetical protein QUC31_002764 [Theobroma cacao]
MEIETEEEEAKKERKKEKRDEEEKRREKKERDKVRDSGEIESKKHGHKERHEDERSQEDQIGGDHQKRRENEIEEHGHAVGSQNSSDSTLNSNKRQKLSSPPSSGHNSGSFLPFGAGAASLTEKKGIDVSFHRFNSFGSGSPAEGMRAGLAWFGEGHAVIAPTCEIRLMLGDADAPSNKSIYTNLDSADQ